MNKITADTANKMLPLVRPITKDIKDAWKVVESSVDKLQKIFSSDERSERLKVVAQTLRRATNVLKRGVDELEHLECIVESCKEGVIDFPSEVDGEEVMLCWRLGEEEVVSHHRRGETIKERLLINQVLE